MNVQLLLFAKAPQPGRVKTRLCPPATPEQAAAIAEAAIADTVDVLSATPAVRRTVVLCGQWPVPAGWHTATQRGDGLAERLVHAYADTALPGIPSLLVGMDTPQLTTDLLTTAARALLNDRADAMLGPTDDGGWWTPGTARPYPRRGTSHRPNVHTGHPRRYPERAARPGAKRHTAAQVRDVDTAADAYAVAARFPHGRFARAVRTHLPSPAAPGSGLPGIARRQGR
jgi:glycosyltransferase A (GT-A) superfamily protein (DUF2064 family)